MGKQEKKLIIHPFSDISRIPPLVFVGILKDTYHLGKGKLTVKFHFLRQQVISALRSAPPPGPATYVINCINILVFENSLKSEALSHLLLSAFSSLETARKAFDDISEARMLASKLCANVVTSKVSLQDRILLKLVNVFNIHLNDLCIHLELPSLTEADRLHEVKGNVQSYILGLIKLRLYNTAVALFKQFSLQHHAPHEFIFAMIQDNQFEPAREWAEHMGKAMICFLVQKCTELSFFKNAYGVVKKHNLHSEFPEAFYLYKKSTLRKLVEKGCWDVAESVTDNDKKLVEYLVTLAQDNGEEEIASLLCQRNNLLYSAFSSDDPERLKTQYLQLRDFVTEENICWVDTKEGLENATKHFQCTDIAGIDCEWKPDNSSEKENKASILQIATRTKVFIIDLIALYKEEHDELDSFLKRIFYCPKILKLGYALHNDMERLLHSYGEMKCFHYCGPVLDLQKLCGFSKGGLSGLAKMTVGSYLNKLSRMSNWEQRPLSAQQLQYAALDAVVLLLIFDFVLSEPLAIGKETRDVSDWKQHVFQFQFQTSKSSKKRRTEKHKDIATVSIKSHKLEERRFEEDCSHIGHKEGVVAGTSIPVSHSDTSATAQCPSDTEPIIEKQHNEDNTAYKHDDCMISGTSLSNMSDDSFSSVKCASNEELVYASCAVLGLPIPGLLVKELHETIESFKLPCPVYEFYKVGSGNRKIYICSLKIGVAQFHGRPSFSKKEAKAWTAFHAILSILKDILPPLEWDFLDALLDSNIRLLEEHIHVQAKTKHEDNVSTIFKEESPSVVNANEVSLIAGMKKLPFMCLPEWEFCSLKERNAFQHTQVGRHGSLSVSQRKIYFKSPYIFHYGTLYGFNRCKRKFNYCCAALPTFPCFK